MSHGPIDEGPRDGAGGARDEPREPRPDDAGDAIRRARERSAAPGGGGGGRVYDDDGPSAATYAGVGLQFLGAILLFLYIGRWLDARLGTSPGCSSPASSWARAPGSIACTGS